MKRFLWKLFAIEHFDRISAETRVPQVRFIRWFVRFGMWFYLVAIPIMTVGVLVQGEPLGLIGVAINTVLFPFIVRLVATGFVWMHQGKS
ncbi:MAG TPA: hypothetical protein VK464_08590 [Symbiobacteriaceae bacterium]|jgi:hypothetical protein|nr:hypothetical protein [Symbiobacteriaceae bacterium]